MRGAPHEDKKQARVLAVQASLTSSCPYRPFQPSVGTLVADGQMNAPASFVCIQCSIPFLVLSVLDSGAGTGLWERQVVRRGCHRRTISRPASCHAMHTMHCHAVSSSVHPRLHPLPC